VRAIKQGRRLPFYGDYLASWLQTATKRVSLRKFGRVCVVGGLGEPRGIRRNNVFLCVGELCVSAVRQSSKTLRLKLLYSSSGIFRLYCAPVRLHRLLSTKLELILEFSQQAFSFGTRRSALGILFSGSGFCVAVPQTTYVLNLLVPQSLANCGCVIHGRAYGKARPQNFAEISVLKCKLGDVLVDRRDSNTINDQTLQFC